MMTADNTSLWMMILAAGVGTFLLRLSFIAVFSSREPARWLKKALRFVPASVLSALVAPAVILGGGAGFHWGNERMWAGALAALVAWRTRSVLLTIFTGMAALWFMTWGLN